MVCLCRISRVEDQTGDQYRRLRFRGSSKRAGYRLRLPEEHNSCSTAAVRRRRRHDVFLRATSRQRSRLQPASKESVLYRHGSIDFQLSSRLRR